MDWRTNFRNIFIMGYVINICVFEFWVKWSLHYVNKRRCIYSSTSVVDKGINVKINIITNYRVKWQFTNNKKKLEWNGNNFVFVVLISCGKLKAPQIYCIHQILHQLCQKSKIPDTSSQFSHNKTKQKNWKQC